MIQFNCRICGQTLALEEPGRAGLCRCPSCGTTMRVTATDAPATATAQARMPATSSADTINLGLADVRQRVLSGPPREEADDLADSLLQLSATGPAVVWTPRRQRSLTDYLTRRNVTAGAALAVVLALLVALLISVAGDPAGAAAEPTPARRAPVRGR